MSRRGHLPTRPTWRCQACGIAWPCSAAKLVLLGEYRENRPGLLVYLAAQMHEATEQLTSLTPDAPPGDLSERFLSWARVRG